MRLARRFVAFLAVLAAVLFAAPTVAFADPVDLPPITFTVDQNLQPEDGGTWDDAHYLDAAKWIAAVDAIPNNGVLGQSEVTTLICKKVVDQGNTAGLGEGEKTRIRSAYGIGTHNLNIGKRLSWWDALAYAAGYDSNCMKPPTPQMPGRGFSGWIDPGPTVIDPADTSVYGKVQYPPSFHTYDQGCGPAAGAAESLDTTLANWIKGIATVGVATANSLHRLVSPPAFLSALNPLLTQGSKAINDAIYTPYIGLSLLILAVTLLWLARKKNLHKTVETIGWMLLMLGVAAGAANYPVKAGNSVDAGATAVIADINTTFDGKTTAADPSAARASLLTDNVLYKEWLMGELGSSTSKTAEKYGLPLLASQTYTYQEKAAIMADPTKATEITKNKKRQFAGIAKRIEAEDPDAYEYLKGDKSRLGAAFISLFAMACTIPFMVVADLLIVVGLLIVRYGVIFAPAVALFSIHPRFRKFMIHGASMVAAGVVNAVIFAAGAAFDGLLVGVILNGDVQLPMWAQLLLCGICTVVLWKMLKPFRKMSTMIDPGGVGKSARRFAGRAGAVFAGTKLAQDRDEYDSEGDDQETPPPGPRTEEWTRPEPAYGDTTVTRSEPDQPGLEPVHGGVARRRGAGDAPPPEPAGPLEVDEGQRQLPAGSSPAPADDADDEPEIIPADRELPDTVVRRGDPVMKDGQPVWRIWDSELGDYEDVDADDRKESV